MLTGPQAKGRGTLLPGRANPVKARDGIVNLYNDIENRRSVAATERFRPYKLDYSEMRNVYKSGLGSKIVHIKARRVFKEGIESREDSLVTDWGNRLSRLCYEAVSYMLAFGRGILIIHRKGENLMDPIQGKGRPDSFVRVFSGDEVTVLSIEQDLESENYYKPTFYLVRGYLIHPSRVIDFTYIRPTAYELPAYRYGGISLFELVYNEMQNDEVMKRTAINLVRKASTLFYKVKGFNSALLSGHHQDVVTYFNTLESLRSVAGATVMDLEDEVMEINQQINNMQEIDQMTLRRLAMVTDIPLPILIGENVRGINNTGQIERGAFIEDIQGFYRMHVQEPVHMLQERLGYEPQDLVVEDNVIDVLDRESRILSNATQLFDIGEDARAYLVKRGLIDRQEEAGELSEEEEDDIEAIREIKRIKKRRREAGEEEPLVEPGGGGKGGGFGADPPPPAGSQSVGRKSRAGFGGKGGSIRDEGRGTGSGRDEGWDDLDDGEAADRPPPARRKGRGRKAA